MMKSTRKGAFFMWDVLKAVPYGPPLFAPSQHGVTTLRWMGSPVWQSFPRQPGYVGAGPYAGFWVLLGGPKVPILQASAAAPCVAQPPQAALSAKKKGGFPRHTWQLWMTCSPQHCQVPGQCAKRGGPGRAYFRRRGTKDGRGRRSPAPIDSPLSP